MDLTFFNPNSQSEGDFLANFVARHVTLDFFLRQLRLTQPGRPARQHLIVAPRGYGKTSLLRRIAVAARTETDLRERFIALSFREEQHNVISLDVFWRNCLQSLAEAREDEKAPEAELAQLDAAWTKYAPRHALKREDQDGEPAWQYFRAFCERLERRPLLLIDNLDSLLAGLADNQQWALRSTLQRDEGPVLIAAASRYPDSTHDPKAAFYEFFRVQTLDKLDDQEVLQCLRTLATHRKQAGRVVLELLDRDPGRVAALNTLAGGNPRTLIVLYSVLESHMSPDVLWQLSAMLDIFSSWYQARMEEIPMQARAVFDALALNWNPMTAAALGEAAGLETTTVSSQLSRLEKTGYVETVALTRGGKGRNGYQVGERFFNIWYLMRNGPRRARQSIKFLILFLQSCFSAEERRTMARTVLHASSDDPGYALAPASSMRRGPLRHQLLEYAQVQSNRLGRNEEYGATIYELQKRDFNKPGEEQQELSDRTEQTIEELDGVIERIGDATELAPRERVARALFSKGYGLGQLGRSEQAIEVYDGLIARFGDATELALREQVAVALFNKGVRLGQLGRAEREIEVYDGLIERFGDATELVLREQVARALVNKSIALQMIGSYEKAEAALRKAIALEMSDVGLIWNRLGNLLLDRAGDAAGALTAYRLGLAANPADNSHSMLHANAAYTLALHSNDFAQANEHAQQALADGKSISPASRHLLEALSSLGDPPAARWQRMFEKICAAVEGDDGALWADYLDDLQRLLWFVVAEGEGGAFRLKMEEAQYPMRYAPLHHAFVAAIDGEDHLFSINPETRQPATRIYEGIARRLKIYPQDAKKHDGRRRKK